MAGVDQATATVKIRIRWADEDGYGHVNNAVYLNYLEEARDRVIDVLFPDTAYDFVIAHIGIDYRAEITHRHVEVEVQSRVTGFGASSVRTAELITLPDGSIAAQGETVLVPRDADSGRSRPLRREEVAALIAVGVAGPAA